MASGKNPKQFELDLDAVSQYRVRVSQRARHAQIKVQPTGDVEVVVPRHYGRRRTAEFLHANRQWLAGTLDRVRREQAARPGGLSRQPQEIHLPAMDRSWRVRYSQGTRNRVKAARDGEVAVLEVTRTPRGDPARLLQGWLASVAKAELPGWLDSISRDVGLAYGRVTIRCQRTRWGSCSPTGDVSLNRNLLFLPWKLVRYLMIHELCHTVHLNHSKRYWRLVSRFEPDYRELDKELRRADHYVPLWAYPRLDAKR